MRTGFGYGDILYVHIVEGAGACCLFPDRQVALRVWQGWGYLCVSELCYTSVAEEKNRAGSTPIVGRIQKVVGAGRGEKVQRGRRVRDNNRQKSENRVGPGMKYLGSGAPLAGYKSILHQK